MGAIFMDDIKKQVSDKKQGETPSGVNAPKSGNSPHPATNQPRVALVSKKTLWYLDNYILLRDYYDRTISRIAARCVRKGNIAIEEYPHYGYILDVLEEISETGNFILKHRELYPYVERKIKGGIMALRRNLQEYELELQKNSSPDMIKEDTSEIAKMKAALGPVTVKDDPTAGAGMNMDDLMNKLMKQNNIDSSQFETHESSDITPQINAPVSGDEKK